MLALLPLLIKLAAEYGPTLTGMLLGSRAGEVAQSTIDVAKQVFGTDDPAAIEAAAKNDPNLVQLYIERVKAETEQYKASLADVADARSQTVKLVQAQSVIAWGAPVISVIITVGFFIVLAIWIFHPPVSDPGILNVITLLLGSLSSGFGAVWQYWLGSSAGSAMKDRLLLAAQPPVKS